MIKLVIGMDEIPEAFDEVIGAVCYPNIEEFLENQFPQWDIELAFYVGSMLVDWENREISVEMRVT